MSESQEISNKAKSRVRWLENVVSVDIRPDYPGGEWPIKGAFRLRGFHSILYFLGQFLNEDPEYEVVKDARTPPIADGKDSDATIGLIVLDASSLEADLSIRTNNRFYSVNAAGPLADWNQDGFRMLYLLFQMTVIDIPRVGVPSITIAE